MQTEKVTATAWEKYLSVEVDKLLDARLLVKHKVKADYPKVATSATYEVSKDIGEYTDVMIMPSKDFNSMKTIGGIGVTMKISGSRLIEYFARNGDDIYTAK